MQSDATGVLLNTETKRGSSITRLFGMIVKFSDFDAVFDFYDNNDQKYFN